ncbi:MAG: bifunctional diguanylate cyclase/phosphodiesterase [Gammaproteobacteria bacterium]
MPTGTGLSGYTRLLREIETLRVGARMNSMALVLLRLKGINELNKALGYAACDEVLNIVAGRLAGVARKQDRLTQLGGDLFALLICNPLHEGHAILGAEKAVRVMTDPVAIGESRARLRASAGIALLASGVATTAEEFLRQGELAVQEAVAGNDAYFVYKPALDRAQQHPQAMWAEVDDGLHRGEFEIHYQPKLDLRTGRLVGSEALARWRHPLKGLISPAQFMPVIEETDSARTLLWYVLNTGLRQAAAWQHRWPGFKIAVNVSPMCLADPDLVESLADVTRIWHFPADQLILEITETALMRSPKEGTARLHQLRELGVQVSIDDFGTGYSSLAYLKVLPADELKIDKSFILPITQAATDRRLVESIIQLGHAVGLQVVAEGIEDEATARTLAGMHCDIGQGFHFGRPLDAAAFEARWLSGNGSSVMAASA